MRRNGKVHLTGNSHGNIPGNDIERRLDVGVDTNHFYPYHIDEVHAIMDKKDWKARIQDKSY